MSVVPLLLLTGSGARETIAKADGLDAYRQCIICAVMRQAEGKVRPNRAKSANIPYAVIEPRPVFRPAHGHLVRMGPTNPTVNNCRGSAGILDQETRWDNTAR